MKISVVMPSYNVEKYIRESIQSVLNQTYSNWELLIVDDGSTDRTVEIIEKTIANDCRVTLLKSEHGGPGNARNLALDRASGEYVTFLDSDDYWSADHLEDIVKIVKNDKPDMVIYNQHTNFLEGYSKPTILFEVPEKELSQTDIINIVFSLDNKLPAANCLVVYRLDYLRDNNISYNCDYQWSEDLDLFFTAISNNPMIKFGNTEYYYYRQDNLSATTKIITGDKYINRLNVYQKWLEFYSHISDENSNVIRNKILQGINENIDTFFEISLLDKDKIPSLATIIKMRTVITGKWGNKSISVMVVRLTIGQLVYYIVNCYRLVILLLVRIKRKFIG